MTADGISKLVALVGRSGAVHALVGSKRVTAIQLRKLGLSLGLSMSKETKAKVAERIVRHVDRRIRKPLEELEELNQAELLTYLSNTDCDTEELKELLENASVPIQGKMSRPDLLEFAASQISSLGMYKRISSSECSRNS